MMRLAGAGMIAAAVVPWLGGASASAAVTVYVDAKWDGTSSATSTVAHAGCDYAELTNIAHKSQGWHFVLPGGSGLTSFSANFDGIGQVTVTTTDTANGVIVQGGKGAVVYTDGAATLRSTAAFANHPGMGSAATGNNPMQLSHLCNGDPTPPLDECTNLEGNQAEVPAGYHQNQDGTCTPDESTPPPPVDVCSNIAGNQASIPAGYHAGPNNTCVQNETTPPPPVDVCSNIAGNQASMPAGYHAGPNNTCVQDATTPAAVAPSSAAASPQTSVLPTKAAHSPTTSVEAVKVPRELPHTGSSDLLGLGSLSLGLLLLGGALLAAPNLAVQRTRRH